MPKDDLMIGGRAVTRHSKPYIIAEACINHQGDVAIASRMVEAAAAAGVDAVKFQLHVLDDEMLRDAPQSENFEFPLYDTLENTNLTVDEHRRLKAQCEALGVDYLCTPFSKKSADVLVSEIGVAALKVGSGELTNIPYQRHLARKGLPMIVSTGMSEVWEIDETVEALREDGANFALMHCVSIYPCPYERVNLDFIPELARRYGVPVGLSCHTPTIWTALGAVSLGASVIEKHFTLDRSMPGPDHASSIEPRELAQLCEGADALFKARGAERRIFDEEREIVAWARESVVTETEIPSGAVITAEMVTVKRPSPGDGIVPAKDLDKVIGRTAAQAIPRDGQVRWDHLA